MAHRTLWDTINDRASATFDEVNVNDKDAVEQWYNKENWVKWYDHYLECAKKIHAEFLYEGLQQTALKMGEHIQFLEKFHPKHDKPEQPLNRRVEDWLVHDGFPILLFVDPNTGERLTPVGDDGYVGKNYEGGHNETDNN